MRYWNAIQRVYVTVRGTNRQFAKLADEIEKYYDFLEFDDILEKCGVKEIIHDF